MSADSIKDYFLEKLKKHDLKDIKGAHLTFHIPLHESFLNFVLETFISDPGKMNDFKEIQFSEMNDDEFTLKIVHKMIDRKIRCKLHDIEYNSHSERIVKIEFLEGIKLYEKLLLSIFGKAKSNWSIFQDALENDDNDPESEFWKISGSKMKINLDALLRKLDLAFLVPITDWKGILTKNNGIVINFELKATQHESNYPTNN